MNQIYYQYQLTLTKFDVLKVQFQLNLKKNSVPRN